MNPLSGRERLLRSLQGRPVDRRPVSPFIHANFVRLFFDTQEPELLEGTLAVYRHFGFDVMHRNIAVRYEPEIFAGPDWVVETAGEGGEGEVAVTRITTPERTLTQRVRSEWLSRVHQVKAVTENLIKEPADFEQFLRFRPPLPALDFAELRRAQDLIGQEGISAPFGFGLFNYVGDLRGLDRLLMDFMTDQGFYHEMMSYFEQELLEYYRQLMEVGIDVVSYPGNMANSTMVGPEFFRRYVFDYEKQIIDFIQQRGACVLYHNCGDARALIEVYNDLGIAAFETLTEPPYGDMDFRDALGRFDPSITLVGNIDQIRFLKEARPEEVRRAAREKLDMAAERRGFILGTSDFLEEGTPYENLFALAEAVR